MVKQDYSKRHCPSMVSLVLNFTLADPYSTLHILPLSFSQLAWAIGIWALTRDTHIQPKRRLGSTRGHLLLPWPDRTSCLPFTLTIPVQNKLVGLRRRQPSVPQGRNHHASPGASLKPSARSVGVDHLRRHLGRGDAGHAMRGTHARKSLLHEAQEALFLG